MRGFCGVAAAGLLSVVAAPAAARQLHQLDLPAGSLQQAILTLGRQARISIALTDPALARITVRRVNGRMTVEQALARMLAGTPARFARLSEATYRIVPAGPQRAPRLPQPKSRPPADPAPSSSEQEQPEIVVTASKRGLALRDYPGPAVVVAGEAFAGGSAAAGTAAISEQIPSLGSTHLGPGRDKLFVRSIADSSFSGQSQSTVGQYLGEARLNYNAPDPDLRLYDIASVELLSGPQGTLYGAGSMGGVLRIFPNAPNPNAVAAEITASVASTAHGDWSGEIAAVANLPVVADKAAVRLVGYDLSDGGYIDDVGRDRQDVNRTHIRGGRAAAQAEIADGWIVEAGALVQRINGRDSQYADRTLPELSRRTVLAQPFSNDYSLAHATLRGSLGGVRMISTFNATDQELVERFDISEQAGQRALFTQRNRLSLSSTETRLSRTEADGSGWLVGAHLLWNRSRLDRASGPPDAPDPQLGVLNTVDEQTLFGEATQRLSKSVSLTGGLRLSHVRFHGEPIGSEERIATLVQTRAGGSEWRLLPSLAVAVEPGPGLALYLRYQESFRPGGLIVRSDQTQKLKSDHIAGWEAGLRFGQRRGSTLSGSVALAYARWTEIQADLIDTVGLPTTANIGDGNIWTLDGRLRWRVLPNLTLDASGIINRSEVTNPDPGIIIVDEAPLPNVPDATARLGLSHERNLGRSRSLTLSAWARYVGESMLGVGPILGREQGEYLDSGFEARLGRDDRFLFLRATNLLDTVGNRFALGSVFTIVSEDQITPLRPRTFRLGGHVKF